MGKLALLLAAVTALGLAACAPVSVTKTISEEYTDPHTGKKVIYTESITQTPEKRMPVHLKHAELYE